MLFTVFPWRGEKRVGARRSWPVGPSSEGERGGRRHQPAAALAAASQPPRRSPRRPVPGILLLGYLLDHQVTLPLHVRRWLRLRRVPCTRSIPTLKCA